MKHRLHIRFVILLAIGLVGSTTMTARGQGGDFSRTFYIPLAEDDVFDALKKIHNGVKSPIRTRTQIVPSLTNTVVYYDHWEDGYEDDIFNPTQSTTQVWGDGILTNGIAPGSTNDIMRAGFILTLNDEIDIPRNPNIIQYDARDRVVATLPISMTRTVNAKDPGEALSDAVNVYPTELYGFKYIAPVGTNTDASTKMFEYCAMMVMAQEDSTIIEIDRNGDGIADAVEILNRGQTYVAEGVRSGASIQANRPIQGHLITGAISANYQMRWYDLLAQELWGFEYFTPVGAAGGRTSRVYLYNPHPGNINVRQDTLVGNGPIIIGPGATASFNMPANTGARFRQANSNRFYMIQVVDVGSSSYDWGHSLMPAQLLTELALVGWGPGSGSPSVNSSPIWVTPTANTTIYVDYDGDPTTGPLVDPLGNRYNTSTNAVQFGMHRIYDHTDNDQTAMRLYTIDGTDIVAVWGQDPAVASAGNPHLDMGYALLPLPLIIPAKSAVQVIDANGDGLINAGDTLEYTVRITRVGLVSTNDVFVTDWGASNTTYIIGSTYVNGTNIADNAAPATPFPLDEGGLNLGPIMPGQVFTVTYRAQINDPLPTNVNGIVNRVRSEGQEVVLFTPIQQGALISGQVRDDLSGEGNLNDLGNPGMPGITVRLFTDPNGDGDPSDGVPVRTNVTGQSGNFFFTLVPPGNYVIVKTTPADFVSTADSQGANDNRIALSHSISNNSIGHIFMHARSGLSIRKTAEPPGIWFPELRATYNITIANTGAFYHSTLNLVDILQTGLTYEAGSTRVLVDQYFTNTFRDNFTTAAYNNNDGNKSWTFAWAETDPGGGGAGGGLIRIIGGELRINGAGTGPVHIQRNADLLGSFRAFLKYDYRTTGVEADDMIRVEASTDGIEWRTLTVHTGAVSGAFSYNITPLISPDTFIRFSVVTGTYAGADDFFYIDNLEIQAYEIYTVPYAGGEPPYNLWTNQIPLFPGGSIEITFTALVHNVNHVTNTACVTSEIWTNPVCSTLIKPVDTSAVPDRIGAVVINDINGNAMQDPGERGIQGVMVQLFSDPDGNGDPSDGILLDTRYTDYQGAVLFGALTGGNYVVVQTDLSGFASTGDSVPPNDNRIPITLTGGADALFNYFFDWAISGLDVQKFVDEAYEMTPGQLITYSIIISNSRVAAQGNVRINDPIPANFTPIPGSAYLAANEPVLTNTLADYFNLVAYTNNDGSISWPASWVEYNDEGRPNQGHVEIVTDLGQLRLKIAADDHGVDRRLPDVTEYHTGTLTFDYRRFSLEDNEYLSVLISTNNHEAPWVELGRFGHTGPGFSTDLAYQPAAFDISAYLTTSTVIRFATPPGGMTSGDMIFIDNIHIELIRGGDFGYQISDPPLLVDGYTIEPYQTLLITYQGYVGADDWIRNEVHVTTAGDPDGQYVWISNTVAAAILTQGWINVVGDPGLAWVASTNNAGQVVKAYDLIYADNLNGFSTALGSKWTRSTTVTNRFAYDLTGIGDTMRFYRVSFPERWNPENFNRYASREVYVGKNMRLKEGENFVSLFMEPETNTLSELLGTTLLPASDDMGTSTRIEWFGATTNGTSSNIVWLSNSGQWLYSEGGLANNMPLPLHEGFNIVLPPGSGVVYLPVIGKLPTNTAASLGHSIPIKGGGNYNVVSYNLPHRTPLKDTGLRNTGFYSPPPGVAANPNTSDELRILSRGGGSLAAPRARILMNSNRQFIFWTGGSGSAENFLIEPDDALIIHSKSASTNYTWNLSLPYPLPQMTMEP